MATQTRILLASPKSNVLISRSAASSGTTALRYVMFLTAPISLKLSSQRGRRFSGMASSQWRCFRSRKSIFHDAVMGVSSPVKSKTSPTFEQHILFVNFSGISVITPVTFPRSFFAKLTSLASRLMRSSFENHLWPDTDTLTPSAESDSWGSRVDTVNPLTEKPPWLRTSSISSQRWSASCSVSSPDMVSSIYVSSQTTVFTSGKSSLKISEVNRRPEEAWFPDDLMP